MEDSALFSGEGGLPDWKLLKEFLGKEGPVTKAQVVKLLNMTLDMLKKEPNLVQIEEPICVVGDIHGQYYDLLNMI